MNLKGILHYPNSTNDFGALLQSIPRIDFGRCASGRLNLTRQGLACGCFKPRLSIIKI